VKREAEEDGFAALDLVKKPTPPTVTAQRRFPSCAEPHALIDFDQIAARRSGLELCCRGHSDSAPMLASLLGYFVCMITMLTAVAVLLTGVSNVATIGNARHHLRPPVIGRKITVEAQRHSPIAKEEAPAKDSSPVVADTKKIKHYKPKVLARQHKNYGFGNVLGYAEESGYRPRGPFFQ
jgi:hypothetical protein